MGVGSSPPSWVSGHPLIQDSDGNGGDVPGFHLEGPLLVVRKEAGEASFLRDPECGLHFSLQGGDWSTCVFFAMSSRSRKVFPTCALRQMDTSSAEMSISCIEEAYATSPPPLSLVDAVAAAELAIIKFTAGWCVPCKAIQPVFEELQDTCSDKVAFFVADVDSSESQGLLERHSVSSLPTFILCHRGAEVKRVEGANERALRSLMDSNPPNL